MLKARLAYPTTAADLGHAADRARLLAAGGLAAASVLLLLHAPHVVSAGLAQTWPPFALVTGLLLIGRVADDDGVFAAAGSRLAALPGGAGVLLAGLLGLVAVVTVVLNLDTAVVFLTPVLLQAARVRGANDRPFLYGCVLMSNSASLLLPGSNLTNLLVADGARISGYDFARVMLVPWLAAVGSTWLVLWVTQRRSGHLDVSRRPKTTQVRGRLGAAAVLAATIMILVIPSPAVPVLLLGVSVTGWRVFRHEADGGSLLRATPSAMVGLYVVAVAVGVMVRVWPVVTLGSTGRAQSTLVGALAAVAMNNLPAAVVLSAHPPAHPFFLLIGLNLAPNLFITGSLSAVLWLRRARESNARPSITTYARIGSCAGALSLTLAATSLLLTLPAA